MREQNSSFLQPHVPSFSDYQVATATHSFTLAFFKTPSSIFSRNNVSINPKSSYLQCTLKTTYGSRNVPVLLICLRDVIKRDVWLILRLVLWRESDSAPSRKRHTICEVRGLGHFWLEYDAETRDRHIQRAAMNSCEVLLIAKRNS